MSHRLIVDADSPASHDAQVILDGKEIHPSIVMVTLEAGFATKIELHFSGDEVYMDVEGEVESNVFPPDTGEKDR